MEELELRKFALELAVKCGNNDTIEMASSFYKFLNGVEDHKTVVMEFKCDTKQIELCINEFTEKFKSLIKTEIKEL